MLTGFVSWFSDAPGGLSAALPSPIRNRIPAMQRLKSRRHSRIVACNRLVKRFEPIEAGGAVSFCLHKTAGAQTHRLAQLLIGQKQPNSLSNRSGVLRR